jgi:hypothetical protein
MDDERARNLSVDERGRLLSRWAAMLASLPVEREQTWRLCEALRKLVGADGAVITVGYLSDARVTVCSTDDVAAELDNLQEVLGEGPGHDAARTQDVVVADLDGADDPEWPMLAQAIAERFGHLRVHAIPTRTDEGVASVVTFYTRTGVELSESVDRAVFLVNTAGLALLSDLKEHRTHEGLATGSWSSRAVVHQATGRIMAQLGVPPDDALALLRGHAYALSTDVGDIAKRVVDGSIDFSGFEVEGE